CREDTQRAGVEPSTRPRGALTSILSVLTESSERIRMSGGRRLDRRGGPGLDGEGALSASALEFIEAVGLFFERLGIARIGGRILGLLMLAERPLTLDEMAGLLLVSRASISTNARMSVAAGLVEHVSWPGDRRDYYR